jgi:hypothetical protein
MQICWIVHYATQVVHYVNKWKFRLHNDWGRFFSLTRGGFQGYQMKEMISSCSTTYNDEISRGMHTIQQNHNVHMRLWIL